METGAAIWKSGGKSADYKNTSKTILTSFRNFSIFNFSSNPGNRRLKTAGIKMVEFVYAATFFTPEPTSVFLRGEVKEEKGRKGFKRFSLRLYCNVSGVQSG